MKIRCRLVVMSLWMEELEGLVSRYESNSLLGGSENHAPSVPPFREPRCGIALYNRKTIAVQCSLAEATQAWEWFAGPITKCSARYTTQFG